MLGIMSVYLCIALVVSAAAIPFENENGPSKGGFFQNFIEDHSSNVKALFEAKKNRIEQALNASYQKVTGIKNSLSNYVEAKQNKISAKANDFVAKIKKTGRNIANSWFYNEIEEPGARMENPDTYLSVPSRITRNGYVCETHIVTSQGYLLNVHRIPRSKNGGSISKNTVMLQHGLFGSSADWILNGPDKGLAYILADAGYDVWLLNIRGNKYSKEHTILKGDSKSFWNFSWHDVALYDIPAIIDYIIKEKGEGTKITYIGHSMGTTILFAMLTLRPEYNGVLAAGFAFAPIAFLSDVKSSAKDFSLIASDVADMKEMFHGEHEFIPKDSVVGKMIKVCNIKFVDSLLCKNVIFEVCGYNENQYNKTLLPVFLSNLGTGTSWKTIVHFSQEVNSGGRFQQFDYGKKDNKRVYGTEWPPEYDLSKITLPIKLFWAENDLLSSEKDVKLLHEKLPSTTEMYKPSDPEFNHVDYIWAIDAPTLINNEVLKSLDSVYSLKSSNFV